MSKKNKDLKVIIIPDVKDYKINDWQIKQLAQFFYENIGDIHKYIEEHQEEYDEWLENEKIKANND